MSPPTEIAVDSTGAIYFVDSYGLHKVVTGPHGLEHSTVDTGDAFHRPDGIALAPSGEIFYTTGDSIRRRSLDGRLTKLAGREFRLGARIVGTAAPGSTGTTAPGSTLGSDGTSGSADGVGDVAEFSGSEQNRRQFTRRAVRERREKQHDSQSVRRGESAATDQ